MTTTVPSFACTNCRRTYTWKPELAGKRVRCKCGTKIAVPAHAPAAAEKSAADEAMFNPLLSALDDLTVGSAGADGPTCPACGAGIAEGAKICIQCGTNTASGRRVKTRVTKTKPLRSTTAVSGGGVKIAGVGLLIQFAGVVLLAVGVAIVVYSMISDTLSPKAAIGPASTATIIGGIGMFFAGPLLCLAAPGAAGRGVLAVAIAIIAGLPFATWGALVNDGPPIIVAIMWLLGIPIAMICMIAFCQQFASYVGRSDLEQAAASVIKLLIACTVLSVAAGGFNAAVAQAAPLLLIIGAIGSLISSILALVAIARYVMLTGSLGLTALRH